MKKTGLLMCIVAILCSSIACGNIENSEMDSPSLPEVDISSGKIHAPSSTENNSNISSEPSSQETVSDSQSPVSSQGESEIELMSPDGALYQISFDFPKGIYCDGGVIWQDPVGSVPPEIYRPRGDTFRKIGGVYPGAFDEIIFSSEDTIITTHWAEKENQEHNYSEGYELSGNSFYREDDILVVTFESLSEGSGVLLRSTHFIFPLDEKYYYAVWFLHNPDSIGAKEFFESIISTVTIEKVS